MKRAILVGAGGMGRAWAKNLLDHPEIEIAAWVDVMQGQAARSAQELNLQVPCLENLGDALRAGGDFVVDVTIPEAHEAVTLEALAAGFPVLGEKPMTISMESARRLVKASEDAGKLYMVSQSRRYDGRQTAFKSLVEQLGAVGILNADFYIGAHFGGFRDVMDHVLILDMAIHTFDQARHISGLDPVSVYAEEFNPDWSWYKNGSSATCLFEMEGGAKFNYRGSWCADGLHTSWEGEWRACGPNGTAKWDGHSSIQAELIESNEGFHRPVRHIDVEPIDEPSGIAGSLREFLWAIETGGIPKGECHDNIKSLAMVFGAIESAKRGARVQIAELLSRP
ncbi:MAG: Gfo/Idh/MocA family oxidoreductase [Armatimonadota bacterium]